MMKIRMKTTKLLSISMAFIFLTIFFLPACQKQNDDKTPFTPESGAYTFYFDSDWTSNSTEIPTQLVLFDNSNLRFMLTIDCFYKENLAYQDITDFDSYIALYNQSEMALSIYEGREVGAIESFKEKTILNGKRQKVFIPIPEKPDDVSEEDFKEFYPEDMTTEVIHLETKDAYFTLTYGNANGKFEESQKKVSEAIKSFKINS